VIAGLEAQLRDWRAALDSGVTRVGWKIGLNVPEIQKALGIEESVIGYLTSRTLVESGSEYSAAGDASLRAEPEVALEIGRDVEGDANEDAAREAIAGLSVALELVDVTPPSEDGIEAIVATNVFHRAVVLGASRPALPGEAAGVIEVNGEQRGAADVPSDFADVVLLTARLLGEAGERLERGDRIIAGSLTPQVPLAVGDEVGVEIEGLGRVETRIAA
jgi:2-keto-4-pentenoate hydratase